MRWLLAVTVSLCTSLTHRNRRNSICRKVSVVLTSYSLQSQWERHSNVTFFCRMHVLTTDSQEVLWQIQKNVYWFPHSKQERHFQTRKEISSNSLSSRLDDQKIGLHSTWRKLDEIGNMLEASPRRYFVIISHQTAVPTSALLVTELLYLHHMKQLQFTKW